jgi:NSS family neurotransmitter:Na+ symporter
LFAEANFFAVMDYVASNILLPVGALLTSVFVGWRIGRRIVGEELQETTPFGHRVTIWLLRYMCPIAIVAVFAAGLA